MRDIDKPHTHAVTFRRYEWLEQLFGNLGSNSGAGVDDTDTDVTFVDRRDCDPEIADLRSFHRIHGIADQIEKHLLDLHAIGQHQVN